MVTELHALLHTGSEAHEVKGRNQIGDWKMDIFLLKPISEQLGTEKISRRFQIYAVAS